VLHCSIIHTIVNPELNYSYSGATTNISYNLIYHHFLTFTISKSGLRVLYSYYSHTHSPQRSVDRSIYLVRVVPISYTGIDILVDRRHLSLTLILVINLSSIINKLKTSIVTMSGISQSINRYIFIESLVACYIIIL
jgi:hypothetical protein